MGTWVGAIVETHGRADFPAIAAKHRIAAPEAVKPWVLVDGYFGLSTLVPPLFAEALSRDLQGTVIAFFVQETASVEQIEHWENGQLMRKLEHSDSGGWVTQQGTPRDWEPVYFFAEDEGTAEGQKWPLNLDDELTDEELARYNRARAQRDASGIMDLLRGGSAWQLERLCAHFGLNPRQPDARYTPPKTWKLQIIVAAIIVFLVGSFLLGILSHRS